jgi:hypothetical protein
MSFSGKADKQTKRLAADQSAVSREQQEKLSGYADDVLAAGQDYYEEYIQPAIDEFSGKLDSDTAISINSFDELARTTQEWAATRNTLFETEGAGAVRDYINYVSTFNKDEYASNLTVGAIGDISQQQMVAREAAERDLNRRGINPNSGVGAAGVQKSVMDASLMKANAAERARNAAYAAESGLKRDAAAVGLQTSGLAAPYIGQVAQSEGAKAELRNANTRAQLGLLDAGSQGIRQPYIDAANITAPIYQTSTSQAGTLTQAAAKQKADSAAGIGGVIGKVAGVGLGLATGNPAFAVKGLMS